MPASTPILAPETLTLEQVKEQFAHWRSTRTKRNKIPSDLVTAIDLLIQQQTYSDRHIAAELGLNYQQLKPRLQQNLRSKPSPSTLEFVECPLTPATLTHSQSPSLEQRIFYPCTGTLELTRSDGTALKASGLNSKDLCSLVQGFLGQ